MNAEAIFFLIVTLLAIVGLPLYIKYKHRKKTNYEYNKLAIDGRVRKYLDEFIAVAKMKQLRMDVSGLKIYKARPAGDEYMKKNGFIALTFPKVWIALSSEFFTLPEGIQRRILFEELGHTMIGRWHTTKSNHIMTKDPSERGNVDMKLGDPRIDELFEDLAFVEKNGKQPSHYVADRNDYKPIEPK